MKPFPERWLGAKVGVLGLARSGIALAQTLNRLGAYVLVSDSRPEAQLGLAMQAARAAGADVETGGHSDRLLEQDLIVISPGVSVHSEIVQKAIQAGVPVAGEIEIAGRLCPLPMIAVTGTNGKSTTATLIDRALGDRSLLAGNIGTPLVSEVTSDLTGKAWIVAEISSFQLETVHNFRPRIAILTNITPDHLDRHKDLSEYRDAKLRLFWQQGPDDVAIFNLDDPETAEAARQMGGGLPLQWLPGFPVPASPPRPIVYQYSALQTVEKGCYVSDGWIWFADHNGPRPLFRWDFSNLPGPHNLSNALAATLAATLAGVGAADIETAFQGYHSLHHRLDLVETIEGVRFIDDSKATNVSSVEAALDTYSDPVVLIAGGRDKGLELARLGQAIAAKADALVVIGEAAEAIASASRGAGLTRIEHAASMDDAVVKAFALSSPGGVVLLSPACTSFDMFLHAEDRGDKFAESVRRLQSGRSMEVGAREQR